MKVTIPTAVTLFRIGLIPLFVVVFYLPFPWADLAAAGIFAFASITEFIDYTNNADDASIIIGGGYDDSKGYFIEPTVILEDKPDYRTMEEAIFGPVMTIHVYDDDKYMVSIVYGS